LLRQPQPRQKRQLRRRLKLPLPRRHLRRMHHPTPLYRPIHPRRCSPWRRQRLQLHRLAPHLPQPLPLLRPLLPLHSLHRLQHRFHSPMLHRFHQLPLRPQRRPPRRLSLHRRLRPPHQPHLQTVCPWS
jgi:hypothetical protein